MQDCALILFSNCGMNNCGGQPVERQIAPAGRHQVGIGVHCQDLRGGLLRGDQVNYAQNGPIIQA